MNFNMILQAQSLYDAYTIHPPLSTAEAAGGAVCRGRRAPLYRRSVDVARLLLPVVCRAKLFTADAGTGNGLVIIQLNELP